MAKVTSKLQLTVPKVVADQYGIRPGDELDWVPAGETIRVVIVKKNAKPDNRLSAEERLQLFDRATDRQHRREENLPRSKGSRQESGGRGWVREDLYTRGISR